MRKIFITTLLLMLIAVPAYADFQAANWEFHKNFKAKEAGYTALELDSQVLQKSQENLADIRITDPAGKEVAYQVLRYEPAKEEEYPVQLLNSAIKPNEYSLITLDLQKTGYLHNKIDLDIDHQEDYLREVTIEGSNNNRDWNLISGGTILSVAKEVKKSVLNYPTSDVRYLRIKVNCVNQKPVQIKGAKVSFLPVEKISWSRLASKVIESKTDNKTKQTEIILDLGVKGYLVDHVYLNVDGQNYNRQVEVLTGNDRQEWLSMRSDIIHDYHWSGYTDMDNILEIKQTCGRYIKLLIHNQDSPPLNIGEIQVQGGAPRLLVNLGNGGYDLWYGNSRAKQPQYDLANFSHLVNKDLPLVKLGHEEVNPDFTPIQKPWTERNKWLLNGIIILIALVLGAIIIKSMKKGNES